MERNSLVPSRSPEQREGASEGNELVATWGNLANARGYTGWLSFAYKRFDGRVPEPGPLDDEDQALLEKVEAGFESVGELYNACKFRAALSALLRAGLGEGAVAKQLPSSGQAFLSRVVILRVVDNLKTILAAILHHTPVLCTGHRSCTSTWGTRGSCSAPSTSSSTRRRSGATRR